MMKLSPLEFAISPLFRPFYAGRGQILMFHRVCPPVQRTLPASVMEVTPAYFEEVIHFFQSKKYHFASLAEIPELLFPRRKTQKFVAFTFDDGYKDNFTTAYPILKKHDVPFAIYVCTDLPDKKAVLWWYMLEDLVQKQAVIKFTVMGRDFNFISRTAEEKRIAYNTIRRMLKYSQPADFQELVINIFLRNAIDPLEKVKGLALDWQMLRELSRDPLVTIGAHTMRHYVLQELAENMARKEIIHSKQILEERLKIKIAHFAYPYGGRNEALQREFSLVKKAGFLTGVTARTGNLFHGHADHLESLPRLDVPSLQDLRHLQVALDGYLPARMNRLKRIVTI
jgi:peptidoglycan/xylan/chitin deacetylase (PgdA/CDA1 family)